MNRMLCPTILVSLLLLTTSWAIAAEDQWLVTSPGGTVCVTVRLADLGVMSDYPRPLGKRLYYRVERDLPGKGPQTILPWSPLGIEREDQGFVEGLTLKAARPAKVIDETHELVHGKQLVCHNHAHERTLVFQNAQKAELQLILRAYDEGIAFRYAFPEKDDSAKTVIAEATGFQLPYGSKAWILPYDDPDQWKPSYENYYENGIAADTTSPYAAGWAMPALFQVKRGDCWVLLAEAAVDGGYCGTRLNAEAPKGLYTIRFPDAGEGNNVGAVEPSSTLPWTMPWRVVLASDSLADIVESNVVKDLNPPSRVKDTSWIKPGRVAWSWWSDHDSPRDYDKQCRFIDLAAEMGWEYYLVDANWNLMDGGNVRQMAKYAQTKGVGLLLWYNSGGDHNFVTEKPRGCLWNEVVRRYEFEMLREWGIKGVKIDFFHSDKQNLMAYYHDILRDAADFELMINFHGCTVPRGWSRTWPHLMSMESVKGAECYTFASEYPEKAPWHNTILPFTRNVVGPMDYTPCTFSDDQYPHITTNAHELALSVVFESGWLHLADEVDAYRNLPPKPKAFLRDVPVVWDETRLLAGQPGQYALIARRSGDVWYLGAINGQSSSERISVPMKFLGSGEYTVELIADGNDARSFRTATLTATKNDATSVHAQAYGGFVMTIKRK